jgi:hypothetical protein
MTEEKPIEHYCEITETDIVIPAFGKIEELHAALIGPLKWIDRQCLVNNMEFTIKEAGFQSNTSGKVYTPSQLAAFPIHGLGMGIYLGTKEIRIAGHNGVTCAIIVTSKKIPHISNRCAECGCQLNCNEIKNGACESCYSMAVNL